MSRFLTVEDLGCVRTVVMSNPGRMNAVPPDSWVEMAEVFEEFEASEARSLILTGAEGQFCAGADLGEGVFTQSAAQNAERLRTTVNRAALALHRTSKPTIAAVDGVAVGAGMNLALGCDIVIASTAARFSEVFARRGLSLDFGGTWLLPRLVGLTRAREIALTGRMVGAEEAVRIGLVSEVVEPQLLADRASEVASELAEGAPLAQAVLKRALDRSSEMSFEQALAFEEQAQAVLLASDDFVEGVASFVERRPPDFKGS